MTVSTTPDDAAARLEAVDTLGLGLGPAMPPAFLEALGSRTDWEDLRISGAFLAALSDLFLHPNVHYLSLFFGPLERWVRADGANVGFTPADYRSYPLALRRIGPRVMAAATSPPDGDGWCSLSLHAGHTVDELHADHESTAPHVSDARLLGGEFAQEREWNHDVSLDWHHLDDALHRGVRDLVRALNGLYRSEPALHALDCEAEGFEWIDASDAASSIYSYMRKGPDGSPPAVVVCNFTPVVREGYRVGFPHAGRWLEVINTDDESYGGSGVGNGGAIDAHDPPWHGRPASASLRLPPLATTVFVPEQTASRTE
jgi:hypothetical protein